MIKKGTWVEIRKVVLEAGERAPHLPEETSKVPLEMRVCGFLQQDADLGATTEILTRSGRRLKGILAEGQPSYHHTFGPPPPEFLSIGDEVRRIVREQKEQEHPA
ncbi:MAG: 2-amino-4-oxopentanoate thiolase subunit OrtA [Spirochaetota bacterium]